MSTDDETRALTRGVLEALDDHELVLAVPHTEYRLHLAPACDITAAIGSPIRGTLHAKALRMHAAQGGGRFIEPVWGAPRIVAGTVRARDEQQRRLLVDTGVPMWVEVPPGQDLGAIREGELLNFYVESGTRFRPVASA
ncbi:MAG: hypothetical protein ACYTE6_08835 [Planctomycetota bacterium]